MLELLRSLHRHRHLLKDFVVRDLKGRYIGSSMGFFWSVIYPILNLCIYVFVFRIVLNVRFSDHAAEEMVALWMLAGITVWTAFSETVSRSTNILVENANLIQKVVFPAEVLPVFLTISSLVNMLIGVPVVLIGVLWFAGQGGASEVAVVGAQLAPTEPEMRALGLGLSLLCLPLLMLLQAIFTLGLGYFLSTLNLFLRDTFHLVGVMVTIWMFGTPIFYPPQMVARAKGGMFAWILEANPLHWLITCYRDILLFASWPDPLVMLRFGVVSVIVFMIGARFFASQKKRFPDLL
jgi:ABC-type polysaccharide/polyol phosphate export permease